MISDANEYTLWEFYKLLAMSAGGEVYDGDDVKWTSGPVEMFNRIMAARFPEEAADELVAETAAGFVSQNAGVCWITGPSTTPADLGWRLEKAGFVRLAEYIGMEARLEEWGRASKEPEGCQLCEARDDLRLRDWMQVVSKAFRLGSLARENVVRHVAELGRSDDSPLTHYLAYLDGSASSACTVFHGSQAAGLYYVATERWARRRGLATAVTSRALVEAKRRGSKIATLQASRDGASFYSRMGFVRRCKLTAYSLDAGQVRRLHR